jgi:6,7-dimethyl-8-ribityllumazine synthase
MQTTDKGQTSVPSDGRGLSIGIVQARFNEGVTQALAQACLSELKAAGVEQITHVQVPGALEVATALQALAERGGFDALIALGYHFELVANESGAAVTRVALDYRLPIANAILTTEDLPQALARQDEKGRDAAKVAIEMARLLQSLAP